MNLDQIKKQRSKLDLELKKLQQSCTHPNIVVTDGGITGNGHVADNIYWTKKWCPDCEWRELIYID